MSRGPGIVTDQGALAHVLGIAGSLLYMATSVPALVKVVRQHDPQAISPATVDLLLLSGFWWIAYSWDIDNLPSLISSAVAIISPIIIMILAIVAKQVPWRTLAILCLGLAVLPLMNHLEPSDVGVVAAAFSLLIVMPMAWSVLIRHQPAPHASVLFWVVQAVTALTWLAYGLVIGHPILGATGLVVAPTATMIAIRVRRDQRQQGAPA